MYQMLLNGSRIELVDMHSNKMYDVYERVSYTAGENIFGPIIKDKVELKRLHQN